MPAAARIEALSRGMADIVPLAEYGQPYPAWPMPVQGFFRDLAATLTLTILIATIAQFFLGGGTAAMTKDS